MLCHFPVVRLITTAYLLRKYVVLSNSMIQGYLRRSHAVVGFVGYWIYTFHIAHPYNN